MDPTPYSSKYQGSGITDLGFLCGLVCFIKFKFDVVCKCRVLFNAYENHRSITVLGKENNGENYNAELYRKYDLPPANREITVEQAIIIARNQGYKIKFNLLLYKQYRTVEFTTNVSMPFGFELWRVAEIFNKHTG